MSLHGETKQSSSNVASRTRVYLQEACLRHQYIRSKDVSLVVERPQRLRAINVGVAAITARLEALSGQTNRSSTSTAPDDRGQDDLTNALKNLNISSSSISGSGGKHESLIDVVKSTASVDVLKNEAVKFVHGDIEGDVYLENLIKWTKESRQKISQDGCEIPEGMSKGDLYRECSLTRLSMFLTLRAFSMSCVDGSHSRRIGNRMRGS